MTRLVQHCLLFLTILVIHTDFASAAMEQFKEWYPEWGFIFARILEEKCQKEYQLYQGGITPGTKSYEKAHWLGAGPRSASVVPLVNCIVDESSEYQKSGMAAANVVLGLTPAILAALGSTVDETSLLYIFGRRPVLGFLLSAGSPGVPPRPLFEYRKFSELQERRPGRLNIPPLSFRGEALIWIAEHLIAVGSIINVAQLGYQLGSRVIMVFAPELTSLILLWLFLGTVAHMLAAFSLHLRVKIKNPHIREPGTWFKSWIAPWKVEKQTEFIIRHETLVYTCFSGFVSLLITAHIIFGTLVFSSALFISVRDCLPVVARLIGSVIACRMVLMYELSRLRRLCQGRDGEAPLYAITLPEEENQDRSVESGSSTELCRLTRTGTDSSTKPLIHG